MIPDFDPFELFVDVREWPGGPAVDGRIILPPISAVAEDIVASARLPPVPFRRWPGPAGGPLAFLLPSKGPGAIVFILCNIPPLVAVLGLTGAYIESGSAYVFPKSP